LACRPHEDLERGKLRMKSRTEKSAARIRCGYGKEGWIAYGEVMISMIPGR
jgi:hypothetical protein